MGQLVNSLLTIVGVLVMMFWISPLLALVALVTVPLSVRRRHAGRQAVAAAVRRSSGQSTGKLNAHIEEMYTGHTLVKVFGRQEESAAAVRRAERGAVRGRVQGAVHQRDHAAADDVHRRTSTTCWWRSSAGCGWPPGALSIGDVQAFIQYSRQFSQPLTQVASMANLVQSGVASAERVFELLDAEEQDAGSRRRPSAAGASCAGGSRSRTCRFRYEPDKPLIEDLSLTVEPGQTVAIVGPTGAGKTTLVNLLMRFYEVTGGRITLDGVGHRGDDPRGTARRDRHGAPGHLAVRRHDRGEHRVRGVARGRPASEIEEAARAAHADRFIRTLPDGYDTVIDDEGIGRQRGREAADHHRAGVPVRPGDPGAGRGDQLGRHPYRGADPAGDGAAGARAYELRDRAPALHHPGRGRDPGDGERGDRRAGHARASCWRRTARTRGCTRRSSRRRWPRWSDGRACGGRRRSRGRGSRPTGSAGRPGCGSAPRRGSRVFSPGSRAAGRRRRGRGAC